MNSPDIIVKCLGCGCDYATPAEFAEFVGAKAGDTFGNCEPCRVKWVEADNKRQAELAGQSKADYWHSICPPLYRTTDVNHPEFPFAKFQAEIAPWQYGDKGLLIHGATGGCKTRCMFLLLDRLVNDEGRKCRVFFAEEWADFVAMNCGGELGEVKAKRDLVACDLLFFDDLFAEKLTLRAESMLLAVLDARMREMRPILATTMYTGDKVTAKFQDPERVAAILRRLRESCVRVSI